jgi:hypothetical protein
MVYLSVQLRFIYPRFYDVYLATYMQYLLPGTRWLWIAEIVWLSLQTDQGHLIV